VYNYRDSIHIVFLRIRQLVLEDTEVEEVEEHIQDNLYHKGSFLVFYYLDSNHIVFQNIHQLVLEDTEVVVVEEHIQDNLYHKGLILA
jgi:hypothetical protein